jgi:hypothetical protein
MNSVRVIVIGMAAACLLSSVPAAAQPAPQVVATGLDNPRGLALGPDGAIYVAESGRGGTTTQCQPAPTPPFAPRCFGATGAITRVTATAGQQQRVITGLPSIAVASGNEAAGPADIDFGFGSAWISIGWGGNPTTRATVTSGPVRFGSLTNISYTGVITDVLDLSGYEVAANPDGGVVDSNPFGLDIVANGAVYADAGANAVMRIAVTGAISTLAVLPNRTVDLPGGGTASVQAVPTAVVSAPSGDVYVGELTGFPFVAGAARVYRVPAAGGPPVVAAEGFTNIIDIAVDALGNAYVLEHDANGLTTAGDNGRLTRIGPFGERRVLAETGLPHPGGVAIGADGAAYVTINSSSAGAGGVVRIAP